MNNGQFAALVALATQQVQEKGLDSSPQAIMLFGLGHLDQKLNARVVRLDGKLVASVVTLVGVGVGFGARVLIG